MKVPSHYRQLGPDEVVRRGDLVGNNRNVVHYAHFLIGSYPRSFVMGTKVWRRCHVKVNTQTRYIQGMKIQVKADPHFTVFTVVKKPEVVKKPIEQNPLVKFWYYSSKSGCDVLRTVRMISANEFYLIGLQVNDKNRFKRFRRDRIVNFELLEFAPASMSK